jgi:hypothetical protein
MTERALGYVNVFPFRCQICTNRFLALWPGARETTQVFDQRQYKRLPTSIEAQFLADNNLRGSNRITEISMGGCTVQITSELPRGTFLDLVLKPTAGDDSIKIGSAMVSSVRPSSMGVCFLEMDPSDRQRLSQFVLSLLNTHHSSYS